MKRFKLLCRLILTVVFFLLTAVYLSAQSNDEPPSRSITSQDFQTKRPATVRRTGKKTSSKQIITPVTDKKRRKSIAVVTNAGRRYKFVKRVVTPKTKVLSAGSSVTDVKQTKISKPTVPERFKDEELGVTFWRLRPLKKSEEDDAPTFKVDTGDGLEDWTAERVSSSTRFKPNDRVRFTIESLRSGYIYILNREIFKDGTYGEAELIYPNMIGKVQRDNRVNAGRLVEVPSRSEEKPYFKITLYEKDYVGEDIIVIISPTKLSGFTVSANKQSLRPEILNKWLNEWSSVTDVYDATDGEGVAYTRTEEEAVTRSLTQEEPLPQTIYRFKSVVGKPLMISFQMQVK